MIHLPAYWRELGYAVDRAEERTGPEDVGEQALMRGLITAFPFFRLGLSLSPGRAHLLAFEAPNLLISAYPLVMVPTFALPLALMLHGLVLWRLGRESASTGRLAVA